MGRSRIYPKYPEAPVQPVILRYGKDSQNSCTAGPGSVSCHSTEASSTSLFDPNFNTSSNMISRVGLQTQSSTIAVDSIHTVVTKPPLYHSTSSGTLGSSSVSIQLSPPRDLEAGLGDDDPAAQKPHILQRLRTSWASFGTLTAMAADILMGNANEETPSQQALPQVQPPMYSYNPSPDVSYPPPAYSDQTSNQSV